MSEYAENPRLDHLSHAERQYFSVTDTIIRSIAANLILALETAMVSGNRFGKPPPRRVGQSLLTELIIGEPSSGKQTIVDGIIGRIHDRFAGEFPDSIGNFITVISPRPLQEENKYALPIKPLMVNTYPENLPINIVPHTKALSDFTIKPYHLYIIHHATDYALQDADGFLSIVGHMQQQRASFIMTGEPFPIGVAQELSEHANTHTSYSLLPKPNPGLGTHALRFHQVETNKPIVNDPIFHGVSDLREMILSAYSQINDLFPSLVNQGLITPEKLIVPASPDTPINSSNTVLLPEEFIMRFNAAFGVQAEPDSLQELFAK